MLAKRTWRGVLICFRGVSAVVILKLEFYSKGQEIAFLRSEGGAALIGE
jgi:hypothetical protein